MELGFRPAKPELSTLAVLGTFYFGPTHKELGLRGRERAEAGCGLSEDDSSFADAVVKGSFFAVESGDHKAHHGGDGVDGNILCKGPRPHSDY